MPGFRYSPTSAGGRQAGLDLLLVGAILLAALVELASERVDHQELETGPNEIRTQIERLVRR
jgi:hypothetical protein